MWTRFITALFLGALTAQPVAAAEPVSRVVVFKSQRMLELWAGAAIVRTIPFTLGGNPVGHKREEGDGRTPEGAYILDWRNPASSYYKSIHVSYPDARDRADAKVAGRDPGGMIMIHGQRNYFGWLAPVTQLFDWTNGCMAVTNADMDAIWNMVPNGTPIEIRP